MMCVLTVIVKQQDRQLGPGTADSTLRLSEDFASMNQFTHRVEQVQILHLDATKSAHGMELHIALTIRGPYLLPSRECWYVQSSTLDSLTATPFWVALPKSEINSITWGMVSISG